MGKALGFVGSPRGGGNTHVLVSAVLEGAAAGGAAADVHTDIILLGDMTIRECNGCHACWRGDPCPMNDDMNRVYPQIEESDFLVFGTPVYWYGPSALMKALIDRFVYFNCPENREKIRGKRAAIAIPFEEKDIATAYPVVDFFERCFRYLEVELAAQVIVPGVTRRGEVSGRSDVMDEAHLAGRNLVQREKGRLGPRA
jgi:multimeric flavodoxin WrbA